MLDDTFRSKYRQLSDEELANIADIKRDASLLKVSIDAALDNCRARSIAHTKLEECVMWAVKGVTG